MASAVCPLLLFWRFSACFGVFAVLAEPPLFSSLLAVHMLVCSSPFVATDRQSGTSSYPRFVQVQEMPGKVQAQKHHIFFLVMAMVKHGASQECREEATSGQQCCRDTAKVLVCEHWRGKKPPQHMEHCPRRRRYGW